MSEIERKFWLVKSQRGPASHEHPSKAAALAEAKRLARGNPDTPFYVCEAVEVVIRREVTVVSLRGRSASADDDGIPF